MADLVVREGELYQCGDHLLACGDLLKGHFQEFFGNMDYHWIYGDPPWGQGNAKYWRTRNNQRDVEARWGELMDRWCDVSSRAKRGVFGEMGTRWEHELPARMLERGWEKVHQYTVTYSAQRLPCLLQVFLPRGQNWIPYDPEQEMLHAFPVVQRAFLNMQPGETVADPCMGLGNTLRAGHERGMKVIGTELNPERLAHCLKWCTKKGMEPKLISTLGARA